MAQKVKPSKGHPKQTLVSHNPRHHAPKMSGYKSSVHPPLLGKDHPLASAAGSFADDPLWDKFVEAMEKSRREIDERIPIKD